MVKDMNYTTISLVLESWERAKQIPDFETVAGTQALLRLWELEPRTKEVFGMDRSYTPTEQEIKESSSLQHAISMIHMFDGAFQMLGPDTDTLREILNELGMRHIGYGVRPHYYPFMGQAVIETLRGALSNEWNDDIEEAWVEVYDELSGEIMRTILNGKNAIRIQEKQKAEAMIDACAPNVAQQASDNAAQITHAQAVKAAVIAKRNSSSSTEILAPSDISCSDSDHSEELEPNRKLTAIKEDPKEIEKNIRTQTNSNTAPVPKGGFTKRWWLKMRGKQ